ncbi:MAG: hypothetical protein QG566_470 [Patescibacteria group bacterium]|nr:hypothetical protein [Patescibacteria group bacterium]
MLYDYTGNRIKTVDSLGTTYNPNKYYEENGTKKTKYIFLNDQLIGTIDKISTTVTPQYIHPDHLGGTVVVTDQLGNKVQDLEYYPFGSIRTNTGSFNEKHKYTGHEFDTDTSLNFMEARYQNGNEGRFWEQDNVFLAMGTKSELEKLTKKKMDTVLADPQSLNSYSYARNNPLKYIDPDGNYWEVSFSGTAMGWSGELGFQFDSSGLNFVAAGGIGAGLEGNHLSIYYSPQEISHTKDSTVSVGANVTPGIGVGASKGGEYQPSTYSIKNPSTEYSLVFGLGAEVYTRKEISIPILGRQPPTSSNSILSKQLYWSKPDSVKVNNITKSSSNTVEKKNTSASNKAKNKKSN